MDRSIIQAAQLSKTFRVPQREAGLHASIRSLFHPVFNDVEAVKAIDFAIAAGERVALIGPNGAGKTTTLKMLAGLLQPSGGQISVAGFNPARRDTAFLQSISMVLGNKSQMLWDIPPLDTFQVLAEIYRVPESGNNCSNQRAGKHAGNGRNPAKTGTQPLTGGTDEM